MSEDFESFDEFEDEEGGSSSRPFLIASLLLTVLLFICVGSTFFLARGNRTETNTQVAQIEATNAAIAATNTTVAQTIEARQTEDARPTDTPQPTATFTPAPSATFTPPPTNTPVVVELVATETATVGGTGDGGNAGSEAAGGGFVTPTPDFSGGGTLPQTGMSIWNALGLAAIFLLVLMIARQIRSNL